MINGCFLSLTDSDNKYRYNVVLNLIDQTITLGSEFYLVAIRQAMQTSRFNPGVHQHVRKLLLKLIFTVSPSLVHSLNALGSNTSS